MAQIMVLGGGLVAEPFHWATLPPFKWNVFQFQSEEAAVNVSH